MPDVPADFPSDTPEGTVPGAQPKVGASIKDGQFIDAALQRREQRFAVCEDLVQQLLSYWERKLASRPARTWNELLDKVIESMEKRRFAWGLSPAETSWIAQQVRTRADHMLRASPPG
jgi:hypothetical protein